MTRPRPQNEAPAGVPGPPPRPPPPRPPPPMIQGEAEAQQKAAAEEEEAKLKAEEEVAIYVALFAYNSEEPGDLQFEAGDQIEVINRPASEWWTGKIGDRTGDFPYNYVEEAAVVAEATVTAAPDEASVPVKAVEEEEELESETSFSASFSPYDEV